MNTKKLTPAQQITYALVRFLEDDSHQITKTSNIEEFTGKRNEMPLSNKDFEELSIYHCKRENENKYLPIQILHLGESFDQCSSVMDSYNLISHAYVRFILNDRFLVIDICLIKEFQTMKPETTSDFKKNELYAGREKGGRKYAAVEIIAIGHPQILNFDKENVSKRVRKTRFNASDILNFNKTITDNSGISSDGTTTDKESSDEEHSKKNDVKEKKEKKRSRKAKSPDSKNGTDDDDNYELQRQILESDRILASRLQNNDAMHTSTAMKQNPKQQKCAKRPFSPKNVHNNDDNIVRPERQNNKNRNKVRRKLNFSSSKRKYVPTNYSKAFRNDFDNFYETEWSDSSLGETEDLQVFQKYNRQNADGQETQLIHLGWNESIPYKSWKEIKKSTNSSKFTKNLCRALYGGRIVTKFLQKKAHMNKVTDEDRTPITPTKMKVFYQCLKYWVRMYHENWLQEESIDEITSKIRKYISDEISYQIRIYK